MYLPALLGDDIYNNNLIHSYAQHCGQNDQVVDGGHCSPVDPLVDRLRGRKSENHLHVFSASILNLSMFCPVATEFTIGIPIYSHLLCSGSAGIGSAGYAACLFTVTFKSFVVISPEGSRII